MVGNFIANYLLNYFNRLLFSSSIPDILQFFYAGLFKYFNKTIILCTVWFINFLVFIYTYGVQKLFVKKIISLKSNSENGYFNATDVSYFEVKILFTITQYTELFYVLGSVSPFT